MVTGRSISILGTAGPGRGQVRVIVDGTDACVIDLAAPAEQPDAVIFAREWTHGGAHVITLEPLDGSVPADLVDAIVVYR